LGPNASGIIGSDVVRNVATINNAGTGVISGHIGIAVTTLTLNNAGKIFGTGLPEAAVNAGLAAIVTNESTGIISGGRFGIKAAFVANVDNAGVIRATALDGVGINASTINVTSNTNVISGGLGGIDAADLATVANAGGISGGDFGIRSGGNVNVTNYSGFIVGALLGVGGSDDVTVSNSATIGAGPAGSGISAGGTATVKNADTGGISGGLFGIVADVAKVDNAGGIAATAASGVGIRASTAADVTNTGTISAERANGIAISARTVTVTNSGTILVGENGAAIFADTATVINRAGASMSGGGVGILANNSLNLNNAGSISATSFAVVARTVDLANSGRISATGAGGNGVNATIATVNNSGTILAEAEGAGIVAINASVMNTGTISAGDTAIDVGVANVFNSGTISGKIGIVASRPDIGGSTIDNSGTIIGTGGTAIKLTSAADTLTLRPGSHIVGVVDMGFGNDVVNVAVNAPNTRVSTLTTISVPTFINFTGVLNTTFSGGNNSQSGGPGRQSARHARSDRAGAGRSRADGFHRRRVVAGAGPAERCAALGERIDDGDGLCAGQRPMPEASSRPPALPGGAMPRRSRYGPTALAVSAPRTKRRLPCAQPTPPGARPWASTARYGRTGWSAPSSAAARGGCRSISARSVSIRITCSPAPTAASNGPRSSSISRCRAAALPTSRAGWC
jgi:hypothetical protein